MVWWEGIEELGVRLSKEGNHFSVFGVGLRGVVCGEELGEPVEDLWIDHEGLDVIGEEEVVEREEEPACRFHGDDGVGELIEEGEELGEAFLGHGEGLGQDEFLVLEDGDVKGVFGDVNTDVGAHSVPSLFGMGFTSFFVPRSILPCSRGLRSLTNLLGVEGQGDRLLLRLLSLRHMESLSLFILRYLMLLLYNTKCIKQNLT